MHDYTRSQGACIYEGLTVIPSYCSLCDREHTNENAYIIRNKKSYSFHCYRADQEKPPGIRKPSIKLALSETALS